MQSYESCEFRAMSSIVYGEARFMLLMLMILHVTAKTACVLPSPLTLQLILEYAVWRSWSQVVLFDNVSQLSCTMRYARPLIQCFGEKGISISLQSATNPNVPDALMVRTHRVGSVVLLDGLNLTSPDNVIQVASQKHLFNYYVSWLMVTTRDTDSTIDTILRDLNIGMNSDVVVATSALPNHVFNWKHAQKYRNETCLSLRRYGDRYEFKKLPERYNVENAISNLNYVVLENDMVLFYVVHAYKIRNSDNTSLVTRYLGFWNPGSHTLKPPVSVKLRNDFNGLPIIFGVLNETSGDEETDVIEAKANDLVPLLDLATFVTHNVNASLELVPYEKLGALTNKIWSHLLGDVVAGNVDIGLGHITINEERLVEMSFSHPLIRYMRNIYYHPLETGTMRDIFLQPFNDQLLGCVAAMYFIFLLTMTMIIYTTKRILRDTKEEHEGIGEATLWCLSILCMQGSPWTPRNPSGKILLLFCLIFALVIYNAYAGFITSILSVQATGIKSISDLLFNNFKLGYSAADDEYIRNVNDSNLRQLYIKAFNSRESRLETTTGLMKSVQERYGFFVSATLARRALETSLIQERCHLRELQLPQTFTVVALPMSNSCPYKEIVNLNILRIYEHGVLSRIAERMLPQMPRCADPTTFQSARLADVYSSFFILTAGMITAVTIGILERIWTNRKQIRERIVRGVRHYYLMRFHQHRQDSRHSRYDNYPYTFSHVAPLVDKLRSYDPAYKAVLQNHAHQVALIGLQKINIPEQMKNSSLEPRLQVRRRPAAPKRAAWSSFLGLSKKKIRLSSKASVSNAETKS